MRNRQFKLDYRRAPGLVGLWGPGPPGGPLDYDMSGRGNDGTWSGTGTHWVIDGERQGIVGSYDGGDESVLRNYVYAARKSFVNSEPFSVSMWVRFASLSNYQGLASTFYWSGGGWIAYAHSDGSWGTYLGAHRRGAAAALTTGLWYCLQVTYTGSVLTCYQNGVQYRQDAGITFTADNTPLRFTIGRFYADDKLTLTANHHHGLIGGVYLYDRGLSTAESQYIYQKTWVESYSDIAMQPRRVLKAAVAGGLSNPIAMRHYLQMQGAG